MAAHKTWQDTAGNLKIEVAADVVKLETYHF